jgi:hypothetical protein
MKRVVKRAANSCRRGTFSLQGRSAAAQRSSVQRCDTSLTT